MQHEHTHQIEAKKCEHQGQASIGEFAAPTAFGMSRVLLLFSYGWMYICIAKRFSMHMGAQGVSISERADCEAQSLIDDHQTVTNCLLKRSMEFFLTQWLSERT